MEAARALRAVALIGIVTRLLFIAASAHRIAFSHKALGLFDANGQFDPHGGTENGIDLMDQAHTTDGLVTDAAIVAFIMTLLYIVAALVLNWHRKRGDELAAAINGNRAIRFGGRLYTLAALCSAAATNAFKPVPGTSTPDKLDLLMQGDAVTIGLQVLVIAFLLIATLAVSREIDVARNINRQSASASTDVR